MQILTLDNTCFDLNTLPDELEDDIRFSILDNSSPAEPDFFFLPLIFLESFNSPAMELEINGNRIVMPLDWHILVGDPMAGNDLEILPLTSINDRGFEAFVFNPLSSYTHKFMTVSITNIYNDVKWYFPKTKNAQLITTPIEAKDDPLCAFFIKDINRQSETLQLHNLL
jgi:hypothetical protein